MCTISYGITVCRERQVIILIERLLESKREEDEIVVLFDNKNGDITLYEELTEYSSILLRDSPFLGNFAAWKNLLNSHCTRDFIFQLDADELIDSYLTESLPIILEVNRNVELFTISRINLVEGITQEHLSRWGWVMNEQGWINFPDEQTRIYKNKEEVRWEGEVHERIVGARTFAKLPDQEPFCILHRKTINRQEEQNKYYSTF